jgi:Domain of unknown function (DUF892)
MADGSTSFHSGLRSREGIAGIIEEGKSIMEEDFDETTMDACLIAGGQRAEHYEMAAYGTLVAWAQAMGHTEAANLLQQTLDEEKAADKKLSGLAESGIDQSAADAAHPEAEQEPVGAGAGSSRKGASAGSADMLDTKVGQDPKDDPADVARVGFDAMMRGDGDVVSGWKNELHTAMASVTPAGVLAEQHRKMAEPGSAKKAKS